MNEKNDVLENKESKENKKTGADFINELQEEELREFAKLAYSENNKLNLLMKVSACCLVFCIICFGVYFVKKSDNGFKKIILGDVTYTSKQQQEFVEKSGNDISLLIQMYTINKLAEDKVGVDKNLVEQEMNDILKSSNYSLDNLSFYEYTYLYNSVCTNKLIAYYGDIFIESKAKQLGLTLSEFNARYNYSNEERERFGLLYFNNDLYYKYEEIIDTEKYPNTINYVLTGTDADNLYLSKNNARE